MKSKSFRQYHPEQYARFISIAFGLAMYLMFARQASAAFGFTDDGSHWVVDTGGGLVFKVQKSNSDLASMVYNGNEYQVQSPWSHVNSGLGASCTCALVGTSAIKITCNGSSCTHYYMAKSGQPIIYMATYVTADTEWRYIAYLNRSLVGGGPTASDTYGNTGAIESSDIFGMSDGTTRSKYYSMHPMKDNTSHSAGSVVMYMGNRETSSGGPFFRDIEFQGNANCEIYNYMKSGHNQTESWRSGLHGVYALSFSGSPDFGTWLDSMGLSGYVAQSGRGRVNATLSGGTLVGYANSAAQYWSGSGYSPYMKPGTYTMTLYSGELNVGSSSVSVSAGGTTSKSISSSFSTPATIWRMGSWDGTPSGFLNASLMTYMHPSDKRCSSWGPVTVSSSSAGSFPCYMWKGQNNACKITFTLTSSQVAAHTIRIGITAAYAGGRPQIKVNSWTSSAPGASSQPDSRSLTIGTYRGNNTQFTYAVPASAFVAGSNTLEIDVISGSSGTGFLSPGMSIDCIELQN